MLSLKSLTKLLEADAFQPSDLSDPFRQITDIVGVLLRYSLNDVFHVSPFPLNSIHFIHPFLLYKVHFVFANDSYVCMYVH